MKLSKDNVDQTIAMFQDMLDRTSEQYEHSKDLLSYQQKRTNELDKEMKILQNTLKLLYQHEELLNYSTISINTEGFSQRVGL